MLTLRGATLLHVAAEYGFFNATRLLLDRGAGVNVRADIDADGVGGQTPIFHALTHFKGVNPEVGELLIHRGADLTIRAPVPATTNTKAKSSTSPPPSMPRSSRYADLSAMDVFRLIAERKTNVPLSSQVAFADDRSATIHHPNK